MIGGVVASATITSVEWDQAVAQSDDGFDRLLLVVLRELAAKSANRDPNRVGEWVGMLVPDMLEQVFLTEHLVDVGHEVTQQRELLGSEVEVAVVAAGPLLGVVKFDVADNNDRCRATGLTSQERAHTSGELAERERFDQVVVSAVVETLNTLVDRIAGGEHKDAWRVALLGRIGPKLLTDFESIDTRHGQVETDEVVRRQLGFRECLFTVVGEVDCVALAAQPPGNRLRQFDFVVDHKNPHGAETSRESAHRMRSVARMVRHVDCHGLTAPFCAESSHQATNRSPSMTDEADPPSLERALVELRRVIVGQERLVERLLVALVAGGHCLLEGPPGLAKTLSVRTLAETTGGTFSRVQFTPDLLPADITGTRIYRASSEKFDVELGPVFANFVLADEINRAPAKVQSALLEVMGEGQVTIGGETFEVPKPFLVLATQNPIESEGVYSLPEAQRDRFLMKVLIDYPSGAEEMEIVRRMGTVAPTVEKMLEIDDIVVWQERALDMIVDQGVLDYAVNLVLATRTPAAYGLDDLTPMIDYGASPRASLGLVAAGRALALLRGRDYVVPQDVFDVAPDVLRHRIVPSYEALAAELDIEQIVVRILSTVPAQIISPSTQDPGRIDEAAWIPAAQPPPPES